MPVIQLVAADAASITVAGSPTILYKHQTITVSKTDYNALSSATKGLFRVLQEDAVGALTELFTSETLIAAAGNTTSAWVDVSAYQKLHISKTSTGGVYALEIDWGRISGTVDFVETVATTNNAGVTREVIAPFARFRVKNTDGVNAFTVHRTNIFGR